MEFNRASCREKFAKVASLMGVDVSGLSAEEASIEAVEAVRRLIQDLNIPQHLSDLDIPKEALEVIPERCMETQARLIALNPQKADIDDLKRIVAEAY
jgi:alcohol dehydrogenase class IV